MASIRKRPGSKYWQAQFYVKQPDGSLKQVRQTTGCTNGKKALMTAMEMEKAANGVIAGDSDKRARAKHLLAEAVRELESGTFNAPKARRYFAELLAINSGGDLPQWTVRTWCDEWLRRKCRQSSDATQARYRGHIRDWLTYLGEVADRPLEAVTAQHARGWKEHLENSGRSTKTVQGRLKDANSAFRAAIREGIIIASPFGSLGSGFP